MGCFGKTLLLLWAVARAHRITNGRVAADVSDAGFLTSITDEDGEAFSVSPPTLVRATIDEYSRTPVAYAPNKPED